MTSPPSPWVSVAVKNPSTLVEHGHTSAAAPVSVSLSRTENEDGADSHAIAHEQDARFVWYCDKCSSLFSCMSISMYVCFRANVHAVVYACVFPCECICFCTYILRMCMCGCVCVCVYINVYVYVCSFPYRRRQVESIHLMMEGADASVLSQLEEVLRSNGCSSLESVSGRSALKNVTPLAHTRVVQRSSHAVWESMSFEVDETQLCSSFYVDCFSGMRAMC
jgi:hypothetical protein